MRIGIDTGEPVAGEGRYVRPRDPPDGADHGGGHGGQILLSRTTRDLVRDDLPPDTALRVLGSKRLKDLEQPVELFQVVAPDLPSRFPHCGRRSPGVGRSSPAVAVPAVAVGIASRSESFLLTRGRAAVVAAGRTRSP